jgi:hypothetical protein
VDVILRCDMIWLLSNRAPAFSETAGATIAREPRAAPPRRHEAAVRTVRRPIEVGPDFHAERLVGTLGVVLLQKGVEAPLLLQEVGCGRLGRLLLEGEVHALVPSVLFRMATEASIGTAAGGQKQSAPFEAPAG